MNVRSAAARLEISASTVYALVAAGKLGCTRHGVGRGCIRISQAQLEAYLMSTMPDPPETGFGSMRL